MPQTGSTASVCAAAEAACLLPVPPRDELGQDRDRDLLLASRGRGRDRPELRTRASASSSSPAPAARRGLRPRGARSRRGRRSRRPRRAPPGAPPRRRGPSWRHDGVGPRAGPSRDPPADAAREVGERRGGRALAEHCEQRLGELRLDQHLDRALGRACLSATTTPSGTSPAAPGGRPGRAGTAVRERPQRLADDGRLGARAADPARQRRRPR